MGQSIVNILFAALAVVLYWQSPVAYDYQYCLLLMWVYVAHNICHFSLNKNKHWLGFQFFFAISFFFVNFVYPVTYGADPDPEIRYQSFFVFLKRIEHDVITKSTAIAYVGYAFYLLGMSEFLKVNRPEPEKPSWKLTQDHYLWFFAITLVSFVLYCATGGITALRAAYHGGGDLKAVGLYSYFNNIFTISCTLMAIFLFRIDKQKWWFYALVIVLCMLVTMSTGSRQLGLRMALILMCGFSLHVYQFKWWQVGAMMMVGIVGLYAIVTVRKLGWDPAGWVARLQETELNSYVDMMSDLVVNNLNLYVLVDFNLTHDLTWFHGMLIDLSSPIPGLASRIIAHFHEPVEMLEGGALPTYIMAGANQKWGSGTNMVGEAYRSFGIVGVCVWMYMIGWSIKEFYHHAKDNIYCYLLYFLFVSHAVVYPRAPILFNPRTQVWSMLILWVVLSLAKDSGRIKAALDKLWPDKGLSSGSQQSSSGLLAEAVGQSSESAGGENSVVSPAETAANKEGGEG